MTAAWHAGHDQDAQHNNDRSTKHKENALQILERDVRGHEHSGEHEPAVQHEKPSGEAAVEAETTSNHDWKTVLERVRWMTFDAAWHANNTRSGNHEKAEGDKRRFEHHAHELVQSKAVTLRLATHIKWMCWNAAWHAANDRAKHFPDAKKDKVMFRKHARLLHRREEKGVNLGGWLLLERWMCSGVFKSFSANDEFTLSSAGADAQERIREWRETFITEQDFAEIARSGFTSVRLPYAYWSVDVQDGAQIAPFVEAHGYLDRALQWADAHGLSVILDLHAAPGFQSGHQACGRSNALWRPSDWNVPQTIEILRSVAMAFKHRQCVTGMAVINEPSNRIDAAVLVQFYKDAYAAIRQHMPADRVTVYFPVYCRSIDVLTTVGLNPDAFSNVMVDLHLYQCFGVNWQRRPLQAHLVHARSGHGHCPGIDQVLRAGFEVAVSEWSLRLPLWKQDWPAAREWRSMDASQRSDVMQQFASNQLAQFKNMASGWTFWCWKTDALNEECWRCASQLSAKECLARGWLKPEHF